MIFPSSVWIWLRGPYRSAIRIYTFSRKLSKDDCKRYSLVFVIQNQDMVNVYDGSVSQERRRLRIGRAVVEMLRIYFIFIVIT
jgi:hypothetical protein